LARASVAAGADALFMEVHDDPDHAKSDPATVLPVEQFAAILASCMEIRSIVHDLV
jgi:2-dehydro-3-deoxyphosphooctonate aldolase (KDO 8-P synthase)